MEEEIDLRAYVLVLLKYWKWILGAAAAAAVVALVVSFLLLPPMRPPRWWPSPNPAT